MGGQSNSGTLMHDSSVYKKLGGGGGGGGVMNFSWVRGVEWS